MDAGARPATARAPQGVAGAKTLLGDNHVQSFQGRWDSIQVDFVNDPQRAVQQADRLVDEVIQSLMDGFARDRGRLQERWDQGEQVSTEDLRQTLQHYRRFFHHVLALGREDESRAGPQASGEAQTQPDSPAEGRARDEGVSQDQPDEDATAVRDAGNAVEVPIVEEELVKRPVVKGVVRVRKTELTDHQTLGAARAPQRGHGGHPGRQHEPAR